MNLKKKIIGILGMAVITIAMFFSAGTLNSSNGDLNLKSLAAINNANAETAWLCTYTGNWQDRCSFINITVINCRFGSTSCAF